MRWMHNIPIGFKLMPLEARISIRLRDEQFGRLGFGISVDDDDFSPAIQSTTLV